MAQIGQALEVHGGELLAQGALRLPHQHLKLRVPQQLHQVCGGILRRALLRLRQGQALSLDEAHFLQLGLGPLEPQGAHRQLFHQLLRRHRVLGPHEVQIQQRRIPIRRSQELIHLPRRERQGLFPVPDDIARHSLSPFIAGEKTPFFPPKSFEFFASADANSVRLF